MGGDLAPDEILKGAALALKEYPIRLLLVGPGSVIQERGAKAPGLLTHPQVEIHHASEVVEMGESPAQSFKKKKDSSIRVGMELVKTGQAQAFVSAGNTGAVMATATLVLGRIPNIDRPAIATVFRTHTQQVVMLDMGSNSDCKPQHLAQFALMGHYYSQLVLNVPDPKVGLLNIGEEPDKGNAVTQAAFYLLEKMPIRFIGNIESKEILKFTADVVVCDGFVGNALLKFGEGVVEFLLKTFKEECKSSVLARMGIAFLLPALSRFKKHVDYEEAGGAPLLGVNGVAIIAHGKSRAKAIKNAIGSAVHTIESDVVKKISEATRTLCMPSES